MLADCSRWDAECAGTAAERDGTKSLNPRRTALACVRSSSSARVLDQLFRWWIRVRQLVTA